MPVIRAGGFPGKRRFPVPVPPFIIFLLFPACTMMQPEVIIVNKIAPDVLVRNPVFGGTIWNTVLRYGEATSTDRCLRGEEYVRFQTFSAHKYCRGQSRHQLIDSVCMCDTSWVSDDTDVISTTPLWFNYRTVKSYEVNYGDFLLIELTADDTIQDFTAPGPYGH